jgi:hypothetical protein
VLRASIAPRSFANAKVGFPETPSPFETVIPAAGAVIVLAADVFDPVFAMSPFDARPTIPDRTVVA